MSQLVRSFRYPLERLPAQGLEQLLAAVEAAGGRLVFVAEVEEVSYPAAIMRVGEVSRAVVAAGLPPLAWEGGADVCPGCGRPEEHEGQGEVEEEGVLFS